MRRAIEQHGSYLFLGNITALLGAWLTQARPEKHPVMITDQIRTLSTAPPPPPTFTLEVEGGECNIGEIKGRGSKVRVR